MQNAISSKTLEELWTAHTQSKAATSPLRAAPPAPAPAPAAGKGATRSFYGCSVEDAMEQARAELGADALVLDVRSSPPHVRHLGPFELLAAANPSDGSRRAEEDAGPTPAVPPARAAAEPPSPNWRPQADSNRTLEALRRELRNIHWSLGRLQFTPPAWAWQRPEVMDVYCALAANGLEGEPAWRFLSTIFSHQMTQGETPRTRLNIQAEFAEGLRQMRCTSPTLGVTGRSPAVVMLVGPPGSGKTTTLVKLAVRYGLQQRKATQILSMDNFRIGAADQLRYYADILGLGFSLVQSPASLGVALDEYRSKPLVLIDTPGYAVDDLDHGMALARFVAGRNDIDVHLVIPACMQRAAIARISDRFAIFQPSKLLFTMLDAADQTGPAFAEVLRTGKPVSFLAAGQRVPEDLSPATPEKLLDTVLLAAPAGPETSRETNEAL
jgi:flagellar biosynthesis protein FlhF